MPLRSGVKIFTYYFTAIDFYKRPGGESKTGAGAAGKRADRGRFSAVAYNQSFHL